MQKRQLQWFDRYLKGNEPTRTGPPFEWIDQNGEWHGSPGGYPLKHAGHLKGSSDGGTVPLRPGINPTSGVLILALPDPTAPIKVQFPAEGGEEIVGAPTLRFNYSATGVVDHASDGKAHIFGQIVDKERNVVVGNQATPIPIEFDGDEHKVRVSSPGSRTSHPMPASSSSSSASRTSSTPQRPPARSRSPTSRRACR